MNPDAIYGAFSEDGIMSVMIIVLIALGLALEELGMVAQRGAQVVKLDKKMTMMACIWGAFALVSVALGYCGGQWILTGDIGVREIFWIHVVAGVFLALVGINMLIHAFRPGAILEHRMESIDMKHDVILGLRFLLYGFLCGLSCGLLEFRFIVVGLTFFCLSMAFVVIGYLCGRSFGAEISQKAYAAGGGLLCILGIILQIGAI